MSCMASDIVIMVFRPPSAELMDFIAIHSREPKFQLRLPSSFLQFTIPIPAFEPFLRLPRGGCHTLSYLFMEGHIPSFATQNSPPLPRVKSVARAKVPVTKTKHVPAEHNTHTRRRAVPQRTER